MTIMSNNNKVTACGTNNSSTKTTLRLWVRAFLVGFGLPMAWSLLAAAMCYMSPINTDSHILWLKKGLKNGLLFGMICGLVAAVVEYIMEEVKQ